MAEFTFIIIQCLERLTQNTIIFLAFSACFVA
jgi:hypothetical protein